MAAFLIDNSYEGRAVMDDVVLEEIRNVDGKKVCRVDAKHKLIEIVQKGIRTLIHFRDDGTLEIKNEKVA